MTWLYRVGRSRDLTTSSTGFQPVLFSCGFSFISSPRGLGVTNFSALGIQQSRVGFPLSRCELRIRLRIKDVIYFSSTCFLVSKMLFRGLLSQSSCACLFVFLSCHFHLNVLITPFFSSHAPPWLLEHHNHSSLALTGPFPPYCLWMHAQTTASASVYSLQVTSFSLMALNSICTC